MTDSLPSTQQPSTQFARLHPAIQRWAYDQGWRRLRDVQERAIAPILADRDVILAAATASGKTEAAWLPIGSMLMQEPASPGVAALYVAPLKTLINDQHERLTALFGDNGVAVHRWHGDVPQSQKQQLLRTPSGVLLITPESLEAVFVNHGTRVATLLARLRYIVVDELHSFIGTERGAQLQSLLHRVELVVRRVVPRIALSATLGDFTGAADFLRPGGGTRVAVVNGADDGSEIRLQLRGYTHGNPAVEGDEPVHETAITRHLFTTLRGTDNLVFANSRAAVEQYTDRLTRMSASLRVPNEFLPHHGNLSKDIREHVEERLKDRSTPITALCTSTLEMGIDIGSVDSVAQIGAPANVAALRQRLGRSGRRAERPAVLRLYITENALDGESSPVDTLRTSLFQAVAVVELLLERWYEPPDLTGLHLSTLIQQVLSVVAQRGGARPIELYDALCGHGPFARVDRATFATLLRSMGTADLLTQDHSGLLLAGGVGDRMINHYTFYAAFKTVEEYRLVANGQTLGTLPIDHTLIPGMLLIFSGRRWQVVSVDGRQKVIDLTPSAGGKVPPFVSGTGAVANAVRRKMRELYRSGTAPRYLDATARMLFDEGKDAYERLRLNEQPILGSGKDTLLFPWQGDKIMDTLALALARRGLTVGREGAILVVRRANPDELWTHLHTLADEAPPSASDLAGLAADRLLDKYDEYLSDELAILGYAARAIDVPAAWDAIRELAATGRPAPVAAPQTPPYRRRTNVVLGRTPFAVIDLETTGFAAHHHDRIIEIAVVRLRPDGRATDRWATLLNPDRDAGPTHTHGLTDDQLRTAPRFADIAAFLADRLSGHVLVAHNARFDIGFLAAEYRRLGLDPAPWPTICTLELTGRLGIGQSRRLADCCAAAGVEINDAHTALGDATATAGLFQHALHLAAATDLASLGCRPAELPAPWIGDAPGFFAALPAKPGLARSDLPTPVRTRLLAVSLAGIAARVQAGLTGDHPADAYLDVLDRALRDGMLTREESADLIEIAKTWGLTRTTVQRLNAQYLAQLTVAAPADPTIAAQLVRLSEMLAA